MLCIRERGEKGISSSDQCEHQSPPHWIDKSSKPGKKVTPKCDDHTSADRRPVAAVYPPDSPHNFIIIV